MSKAERRKRSRQRARERQAASERGALEQEATPAMATVVTAPSSEGAAAAPPVAVAAPGEPESAFITGPIAPRSVVAVTSQSEPRRAERLEVPAGIIDAPIDGDFEPGGEGQGVGDESAFDEDDADEDLDDGDEDGDEDDDDDDDDDDDEDGDEDGDEDDDDDGPVDVDDALMNVACGAIEQKDKLTWNELVASLSLAEVDDPRLGLLLALLVEQDGKGELLRLTGERVLRVLREFELDDLIEEAEHAVRLAPSEPGEALEEAAIVRATARQLDQQAKRELAAPSTKQKPMRASDVRARQSALGVTVPAPGRAVSTRPASSSRRAGA